MKYVAILAALAATVLLLAADGGGPVTYMDHDKVSALFAKGGSIAKGPDFSVSMNRRTGPGQVEVHDKETDVIYVMDGEATFVTGGTMVGGKQSKEAQWLGTDIKGGTSHHLTKGDVIAIPAGTPHWFKEVKPDVTYYVVKSIRP
jgi:mannose-6-phosphate isomerase-like protein (cupin superfamily)